MSDTEVEPPKKPKLDSEPMGGLPPGAKPLSHQVAGHATTAGSSEEKGFYECEDGTILKALHPDPDPRGPREVSFYEKIFNNKSKDPILDELRPFLPKFVGVVTTEEQNKTRKFLQLEDVAAKFQKPCVIDVKIGKITYDPDATPEKRAKESNKYPPLKKIGFQLRGFRVYSASKGDYKVFSKKNMHDLDENTILTGGLQVFFSSDGRVRKDLVAACLDKLLLIQKWFDKQTQFAFYASSLLIVYDGQPEATTAAPKQEAQNGSEEVSPPLNESESNTSKDDNESNAAGAPPIEVRMIDFAHVFPGGGAVDENYAYGLASLIKYLRQLMGEAD